MDLTGFKSTIFRQPQIVDMVVNQGLEAFIEVAKEWDGFETFIPNLKRFKSRYLNRVLNTYTPNSEEKGFNVLNHADFHLKNMLFKKNAESAIEDFYFVSF